MPKSQSRKKQTTASTPKIIMANNNPTRQSTTQTSVTETRFKGEIFRSPYPPPEIIEKYKAIDPNFAQKFIDMADAEIKHRRWSEKLSLRAAIFLDTLGMFLAPAAVAGILWVGILFMQNGYPTQGTTIIGADVLAVAIAFMTRGRRGNKPQK